MNKKIFVVFMIVAMILMLTGCQPEATSSPLSAALSELTGLVELKQADQEGFVPASPETTLDVNGQVQTGDDGRVRLDLSSGTIIRVAPSSFFTLTSNDETEGGLATKIKLELGKIFIILNGGQADVETPSGVATVRGSYMKVEVDPVTKDIYVTCLEGNCSASNPAGAVNFTNGEKVVLYAFDETTGKWTAPDSEPMTPEDFKEWLDNNPEAKELYDQAMGTATALAATTEAPTETPTEEATPELTEESNTGGNGCFKVIQPQEGEGLNYIGQETFEWEDQDGAQGYKLTFVDQNGNTTIVDVGEDTLYEPYMEAVLPNGGEFSWYITAYGEGGNELCSTAPSTFEKPKADPTQKPDPTQDPADKPTKEPTCDPEFDPYCCPPEECPGGQGGFIPERDIAKVEEYVFFS